MRKNGEFNPKRYKRNDVLGYSYQIISNSYFVLMAFGLTNDNYKDITLRKKDYSNGYCEQHCYNYNDEEFALCGKFNFNIKRIVVYQLK